MKFFGITHHSYLLKFGILIVGCLTIGFLITEHVEAPREAVNIFPRPVVAKRPLSIYAVGNINLAGTETTSWFAAGAEPGFAALLRELGTADLAFGNLDCQMIRNPQPEGRLQAFSAAPASAEALANAGFDLLSTANELSSEFDAEALTETISNLRRVGIRHAGTGRTIDEAYEPAEIERHGWRIALFGVTAVFDHNFFGLPSQSSLACANITRLSRQIALARQRFDLILISYHGGEADGTAPSAEARFFAQRCIEAGADIVLGHHPHAPQTFELYRNRLIFYSLGDFIGNNANRNASDQWADRSLAARIFVSSQEATGELKFSVERVPLLLNKLPHRAEGKEAEAILAQLQPSGLPSDKVQPLGRYSER